MLLFIKVALKYSSKFGTDRVRVLTFEKNRGKGGAVRLVWWHLKSFIL